MYCINSCIFTLKHMTEYLISSESCIKPKFTKLKNSITFLSIKITLLIFSEKNLFLKTKNEFKKTFWCLAKRLSIHIKFEC